MDNSNKPASELTKLEYALIHSAWHPSTDDIETELRRDKAINPYNEPHKKKLRSRKEVILELTIAHFKALLSI